MQDSSGDVDIGNRLADTVEEGEGGTSSESNIETYILPYVKQMTSASLMYEVGHSKLVFWANPEGWGGDGGGRGSLGWWDTHTSMADPCQCMVEATTVLCSN